MVGGAHTLLFPNDAVTKAICLRGGSCLGEDAYDGNRRAITVSRSDRISAHCVLSMQRGKRLAEVGGALNHLDLCVLAAVAAAAQDGLMSITVAQVLKRLGYRNPHAASMRESRTAVTRSLRKMGSILVELPQVVGRNGRLWMRAIPKMAVINGVPMLADDGSPVGVDLRPGDPEEPLSALPLIVRACDCGQVIPVSEGQMPAFERRRVSFVQRQMALYMTVRALEQLRNDKVLLSTLFRDVMVDFPDGGAGRQARHRELRQLFATLDAMSEQGTVITDYEVERVRGKARAITMVPARTA